MMTYKPNNKFLRTQAANMLYIMLGIMVYSIGFCVFVLPHNVVIGGMAGFSTLVFHATSGAVPVAVTMYGANILLLLLGGEDSGQGVCAAHHLRGHRHVADHRTYGRLLRLASASRR